MQTHVLKLTAWNQEYQIILEHQRHVLRSAFKFWVNKTDVGAVCHAIVPDVIAFAVITSRQVSFEKHESQIFRYLEECVT